MQSYSFSISLFDKWMWNGTILDNRTRLLMKLLTTSSADIIQECLYVMFGVKSVSKSIFKRRRNVLPVVVFKMSNIRRIKLNNKYIITATQWQHNLCKCKTNVSRLTESQHHEMIVQVITVRLVKTQNHGNLWPADGAHISTPPCLPTTPLDTKIIRLDRLMF